MALSTASREDRFLPRTCIPRNLLEAAMCGGGRRVLGFERVRLITVYHKDLEKVT